jgi:hypothetical protein
MARVLLSAAAGAVGMYLLDPMQGARRRAMVRDQALRLRSAYSSRLNVPALQGGVPSWGERPELSRRRPPPAARLLLALAVFAGAALLLRA